MAPLPIKFTEVLQLTSVGVDTAAIGFNSCVSSFLARPFELTSELLGADTTILPIRLSSRTTTSAYARRRTRLHHQKSS